MRRSLQSLTAVALVLCATRTLAAPEWDIVGIRLGMTPQQARAALQAHAPQAAVTENSRQFSFDDGTRQQSLPAFLASLVATQGATPSKSETLEVMFSAPPMEQRVIRVVRTVTLQDDPIPLDRAMGLVAQKYGAPPRTLAANDGRGQISRWVEAGKSVCGDTAPTSADARLAPPVDNAPGGLSHYEAWKRRKLAPADAAGCSAALVVNLVTRAPRETLVTQMKFTMTDPGYAVPAMKATADQIAEAQARARKAREGSGAAPRL